MLFQSHFSITGKISEGVVLEEDQFTLQFEDQTRALLNDLTQLDVILSIV
jgi:hypothetical protein